MHSIALELAITLLMPRNGIFNCICFLLCFFWIQWMSQTFTFHFMSCYQSHMFAISLMYVWGLTQFWCPPFLMVKSNVKKHFRINVHIKLYMLLTLGQWSQIVTRTGQGLESQRRDYKQIKLAASDEPTAEDCGVRRKQTGVNQSICFIKPLFPD